MKPLAIIAASSLAALVAGFAVAQPQPIPPAGGGDRDRPRQERSEGTKEDRGAEWRERRAERMRARLDERLTKLRADMKLKPEQVPLFDTVEALIKKRAGERGERAAAMREQRETFRHADIMERLDMMSGRQAARAAASKELADAVRPLWSTLSDEQKTVARRAVRQAMGEGRERMREMRGRFEDRGERRGWRGDDERGSRHWHHNRDRDRDERRRD